MTQTALRTVKTQMMSNSSLQIHVFMVSYPGQGHISPLLRLGRRLSHFGWLITLCAPEAAGASIRKANAITDDEPRPFGRGTIRFEFFDDEWDPTRSTHDCLTAYVAQLEHMGREKLPQIIRAQAEAGRPVSCLINNPFVPWISDVAEELGIPSAMLWVQSCACFSAYYHYHDKLVQFPTEEESEVDVELPFLPLLKHDEFPSFLHPSSPYGALAEVILGQFGKLRKPFCVLMDTFEELEQEIVDYMVKVGVPVKTIGPLFKEVIQNTGQEQSTSPSTDAIRADFYAAEACTEWLDAKPPHTVVYISFGSVVDLKQDQIDEIAHGLLSSGVSFLWALRPPSKVLLEGFSEKAGDRGKIVRWCPQEEVLAHPSTACFVTHCGWNSTVEALASGVPVVAFPQWGDQVTNAKFLVDVYGVGIRMSRGEAEGRVVARDEVAACLRAATAGPKVAEMRENALKWKGAAAAAVAEGGSSCKNIKDFVDEVVRMSMKINGSM